MKTRNLLKALPAALALLLLVGCNNSKVDLSGFAPETQTAIKDEE